MGLVESKYGRGVVHVGTFQQGVHPWIRSGYRTMCGARLEKIITHRQPEKLTCQRCFEELGLCKEDF